MADKVQVNMPKIDTGALIDKGALAQVKELDSLIVSMANHLSKAADGKNLTKYWQTQEQLIKSTISAYKTFSNEMNAGNAQELMKTANALKAMHGIDLSDVIPDFDKFNKMLDVARSKFGSLDSAFDVGNFKSAFAVFEQLKDYGLDVVSVFEKLNAGSKQSNLLTQLYSANEETAKLKTKVNSLQDELDGMQAGTGIQKIKDECKALQKELEETRQDAINTFSAFLQGNNIDPYDDAFSDYFDRLKKGELSSERAIQDFKYYNSEYLSKATNNVGGTLDTGELRLFSDMLDSILSKVNDVSVQINTLMTSGIPSKETSSVTEISDLATSIETLGNAGASLESSKLYEALAQVLTTIKELGQLQGSSNLNDLYQIFRQIGNLDGLDIDQAPLNRLAACIQQICNIDNSSALTSLSLVDLSKFNDLHISKASLNNLAEFLPQLSTISVDNLLNLTKVDLSSFNELKINKASLNNLLEFVSSLKEITNSQSDKPAMDSVESTTISATEAKNDFAKANENVQTSVDGSKSKLELEAELMEQIAKSAREAAEAKKEFVAANEKVASSVDKTEGKAKNPTTPVAKPASSAPTTPPASSDPNTKPAYDKPIVVPVDFTPNMEGFDEIVSKFKYLEQYKDQIEKITKVSKQNQATGKYDVSYNARLKDGSTYDLGESSTPQMLAAREVAYNAKEIEKYKNQLIQAKDEMNSLDNISGQSTSKFQELENGVKSLNEQFVQNKVTIGEYEQEMTKLFSTFEEYLNLEKTSQSSNKITQQKNEAAIAKDINNDLISSVQRYETVTARIAKGEMFDGDLEEAKELEATINRLQNNKFVTDETRTKVNKALNNHFDYKIGDIEKSKNKKEQDAFNAAEREAIEYNQQLDVALSSTQQRLDGLKFPSNISSDFENLIDYTSELDKQLKKCELTLDSYNKKIDSAITKFQTLSDKTYADNNKKVEDKEEFDSAYWAKERERVIKELTQNAGNNPELDKLNKYFAQQEKESSEAAKKSYKDQIDAIQELTDARTALNNAERRNKNGNRDAEIADLKAQIAELEPKAKEAEQAIEKMYNPTDGSQATITAEQYASALEKIKESATGSAKSVNDLAAAQKAALESKISGYESDVSRWGKTVHDRETKPETGSQSSTYQNNLTAMKAAYEEMRDLQKKMSAAAKEGIGPSKEDTDRFTALKTKLKECEQSFKDLTAAQKGSTNLSRDKLFNKIGDYLHKNSGMAKEFKVQLEALQKELTLRGADANVSDLTDKFLKLQIAIREAGQEGRTFLDVVKDKAWYGLAGQIATYFSFQDIVRYIGNAVKAVVELDDALIDLKKTTTMTGSELNQFYFDANDVAKQLGVTTKEIIEQSSAWSRLGFSTKQQATEMAKLSSQFASISPGMDTEQAQSGLVSIIKAWDIPVEEVKDEIMSNINQLGNTMAESNQDIVEGMQRSAAALSAVGTSYKDAFALFSGIQEILQQSEVSGRALRSVSMRVRGYDEETEQLSDDLVGVTGKLADLTKTAEHAEGVSIFKPGSTTEFKSLVDYFREIHNIWGEMTQKQQNDYLQTAFGKTQAEITCLYAQKCA